MDCGRSKVRCSSLATFLRKDWSLNHFYGHSFPGADPSRAVVNYWRNDVHLVLVNRLESLPRNNVVRWTDRLDMTIVVDPDVKPHIKQNKNLNCSRFVKWLWEFSRSICAKCLGESISTNFRRVSPRNLVEKQMVCANLREISRRYHRESSHLRILVPGVNAKKK